MLSFKIFRAGTPDRRLGGVIPAARWTGGRNSKPQAASRRRRGVVAVETALTLPVLFLLLFGSIEITNGIFVSQACATAGYEGAREASRPGATTALVTNRVREIMVARGIADYQLAIHPELRLDTPRGVPIKVTITAPMNSLSFHLNDVTGGRTIERSVTMVRH